MSNIADVRQHLAKQSDVKIARIVTIGNRELVRCRIVNELHNRTTYERTVYYNSQGTRVDI